MTFGAMKTSDLDVGNTSTDLYISAGCTAVLLVNDLLESSINSSFHTVWSIDKFMHSKLLLAKQKAC